MWELNAEMNTYELPMPPEFDISPKQTDRRIFTPLPQQLLVDYALWFCTLRWLFIAFLFLFGLLGMSPSLFESLGVHPHTGWIFLIGFALSALNTVYIVHIQYMKRIKSYEILMINVWVQTVLDLITLTFLMNIIGIYETYVAFAYLFHIVLACIFFPRYQSFLVTVIAAFLYVGSVVLNELLTLSATGFYTDSILRDYYESSMTASGFDVISALCIWAIVWYLASHLSGMVREREYELVKTNRNLIIAQKMKTQHLLRITHELKSPFAAIDANIQLLSKGHIGFFTDDARQVLERIALRSRTLGHEIQEMLQLANLNTISTDSLVWKQIDLSELIQWCQAQIKSIADQRNIVIEDDLEPVRVVAVEDHLKMLFTNIISNAVIYSLDRGTVKIQCKASDITGPIVTIEDRGIGIPEDKISNIFEEFYRTDEAARHNRNSTGLGLAIVKQVAQTHRIAVRVSSTPGYGTTFELTFPVSPPLANTTIKGMEQCFTC